MYGSRTLLQPDAQRGAPRTPHPPPSGDARAAERISASMEFRAELRTKRFEACKEGFKNVLLTVQALHNSQRWITHDIISGSFGVITSIIDAQKQWPE